VEDARWFALSANKTHGLKRSNADKQEATKTALKLRPQMSNPDIAAHVGVDEGTVRNYRKEMETTSEIPMSTSRTGRDGRTINTSKIGKSPKPGPETPKQVQLCDEEPMPEETPEPDLSPSVPTFVKPWVTHDPAGLPIPADCLKYFEVLDKAKELESMYRALKKKIAEVAELPGMEHWQRRLKLTGDGERHKYHCPDLENSRRELQFNLPYASQCPYCAATNNGKPDPACNACKGLPYVIEAAWESAPDDFKEAARAA
jgi:hypothetical protein